METVVMVLLTVMVGLFGVTSAVLGFIAEGKRLTGEDVQVSGLECVYPPNSAYTLGICAAVLLAMAQIIASVATGAGYGCGRPGGGGASKSRRRTIGSVFSTSWIAAGLAVYYYIAGALLNAPGSREATFVSLDYVGCYDLRAGVFTKAAVLSLLATVFGIMSCIFVRMLPEAKGAPAPEQGAAKPANTPHGQRPPQTV